MPLSLRLPWLSLAGLSRPPLPSLGALPCCLPDRSGGVPSWPGAVLWPAVRRPPPAVRDAEGWLPGRLAASAAPRPGAAAALLVAASSTASPRVTPMRAPSSAPTTTRSWPRRRSDWSTGPPNLTIPPEVAEAPCAQTCAGQLMHPLTGFAMTSAGLAAWTTSRSPGATRAAPIPTSRQRVISATARAGRQPCGADKPPRFEVGGRICPDSRWPGLRGGCCR